MNSITFTDIDAAVEEAIWIAKEERRAQVVVQRGDIMTVHRKDDISPNTPVAYTAYIKKETNYVRN